MNSKQPKLTPKIFMRTLMLLHLFFTVPPLLFGLFVLYQMEEYKLILDNDDPFLYVVPIGAVVSIFLSNFLFRLNIKKLDNSETLKRKLAGFQAAHIVSYAPVEGMALVGMVAAFSSYDLFHLLIGFILISFLFIQRPSKYKVMQSLNLNNEMMNQFNNEDEEIT